MHKLFGNTGWKYSFIVNNIKLKWFNKQSIRHMRQSAHVDPWWTWCSPKSRCLLVCAVQRVVLVLHRLPPLPSVSTQISVTHKQVAACFLSACLPTFCGRSAFWAWPIKEWCAKLVWNQFTPWNLRQIYQHCKSGSFFNLGHRIRVTNKRLWLHWSSFSYVTCSSSIKPDVTCLTVYWL